VTSCHQGGFGTVFAHNNTPPEGAKIGDNPQAKLPLHTPHTIIAPHIPIKGNYEQKMLLK